MKPVRNYEILRVLFEKMKVNKTGISNGLKIAIFSDHFYPELGGIQDSVACLSRMLVKKGHEINFYVAKYSKKDFIKAKLPVQEINLGANVRIKRFFSLPVPSRTQQSRLVVPNFLRWREVKKFKPDIIHSHTFFSLGLEALATARFLKIPLIGTNHWSISEFNHYSLLANKFFANRSLKFIVWYYNHCDFVTAPSRTALEQMLENGFSKPHQVVSNQIDLEIFKPEINFDIKRAKAEFKISAATVVYAGNLGKEKNIDTIIRAIVLVKEKIPNINFVIAGHGNRGLALKALVKELHLENEVKFLGTLSQPGLARLYQASEIFSIASASENQSMVLLQAMACGLPVLGANVPSLPEYINKHNGYLFKFHDFKELADKIVQLLKNSEERKLLGQGGLDFVKNFSVENIALEWEKIYFGVIAKYRNK